MFITAGVLNKINVMCTYFKLTESVKSLNQLMLKDKPVFFTLFLLGIILFFQYVTAN